MNSLIVGLSVYGVLIAFLIVHVILTWRISKISDWWLLSMIIWPLNFYMGIRYWRQLWRPFTRWTALLFGFIAQILIDSG